MAPNADDASKSEPQLGDESVSDAELANGCRAFGKAARATRQRDGLSQLRAAVRTGISMRYLADLEKGANPSLKTVVKAMRGLEMAPVEVAGVVIVRKEDLDATLAGASAEIDRLASWLTGGGDAKMPGRKPPRGKNETFVPPTERDVIPPRLSSDRTGVKRGLEVVRHDPTTRPVRVFAEIRERRLVRLDEGEGVTTQTDLPPGSRVEIRVHGDAHRDVGINDGDLLTVSLGLRELEEGMLVVALVDGEVVIGRYEPDGETKRITTGNDAVQSIAVRDDQIYGAIVSLTRPRP
jgi:transcriptional regulator with XRE-family HTH domain